jgi:hypothetical protein
MDTEPDGGMPVQTGVWAVDDPTAPTRIPIGTWTQVTATFKLGMARLFIGGELVAEQQTEAYHTTKAEYDHDDVNIGSIIHPFGNYTWQGAIDEVRIYGRALSADEVACLARK